MFRIWKHKHLSNFLEYIYDPFTYKSKQKVTIWNILFGIICARLLKIICLLSKLDVAI